MQRNPRCLTSMRRSPAYLLSKMVKSVCTEKWPELKYCLLQQGIFVFSTLLSTWKQYCPAIRIFCYVYVLENMRI